MLREGDLTGGRFRLIRRIGSGGMASVWWARHELLGRDVALKLSRLGPDEQMVARFLREARIIGKFQHRNIVGVVDAGVLDEEGYVFLAMELLHGASFASRLAPGRPLPPSEVVPLLIEVCRGLEVAHAAGVVHRDMKPENIFLAETPGAGIVPKIVDFGISLLAEADEPITIEGQLLGTPSYMSPEQVRGERNVDARADVWALGVILHEALAGRQPFKADGHHMVLWSIMDEEPEPLPASIDPALRAIVARCLQKDRALRYPDAVALREALEAALAGRARAAGASSAKAGPAALADTLAGLRRTALRRLTQAVSSTRAGDLLDGMRRLGGALGRSWTAIGFVGGVTAAVALAAGAALMAPLLTEGSPADTPAQQMVVVNEALEALMALSEAASRSARPPAVAHEQEASGQRSAGAVEQAGAAADTGAGAAARDVEEQLPRATTRRRSRSVTRPGF